jgi:hypothetical protein
MLTVGVPIETEDVEAAPEVLAFPLPAIAIPAPAPAAIAAIMNHFALPL